MTDQNELKPCPFCGIAPVHDHEEEKVMCAHEFCCAYGLAMDDQQWNTRTPPVNRAKAVEGTERYWLIEQPDLEEDDDYKIIHTTALDVYPDAVILGEYLLVQKIPDRELEEAIKAAERGHYCADNMPLIINAARLYAQAQKGGGDE